VSGIHAAAALLLFVATLSLVLIRPRRVPEGVFALGGALGMLLVGAVSPREALAIILGAWNAFLFFLGMLVAAAAADRAEVFTRLAGLAARGAGGSGWRLLLNLFLLGSAITAILSNDATALLLTPVVFALVVRLGLPPRPYAFTCSFVANAASLLLPVANPANILVLQVVPMTLPQFLGRLLLPALVALAVTFAGLLLVFRDDLVVGFGAKPTAGAADHPRGFAVTLAGLCLLAAGYLAGAALEAPLGLVALAGATIILLAQALVGALAPRAIASEVAWGIFPFLAGMLVLVRGIENAGLTPLLGALLARAVASGGLLAPLLTAVGAALGANLINNLPMALIAASTVAAAPAAPSTHQDLAAAVLLGVDLGPNLTIVGSLSTMLWLLLLRRRGLDVSGLEYLRVGALLLPPALLAAALTLWLVQQL